MATGLFERRSRNGSSVEHEATKLGFPKPISIGHGLYACVATISPEAAYEILENRHIANNRSLRSKIAKQYSSDMGVGLWSLTHQPIAFNTNMELCDGQHRLSACVDSGASFVSIVIFGVPPRSVVNVDAGAKRSAVDAGRILGRAVSHRDIAVARTMAFRTKSVCVSNGLALELIDILREPLEYVHEQFPTSIMKVTISPMLAAVGLAWYHAEPERLAQFCVALREGFITDRQADSAAIALASSMRTGGMGYGGLKSAEAFLKSLNAISYFLQRKPLSKVYASEKSRELFPLPPQVAQLIAVKSQTNEQDAP